MASGRSHRKRRRGGQLGKNLSPRLDKLKKEFTDDGGRFEKVKIGDLFDITTGRDVIIGMTKDGKVPLISHQHENNGITKRIKLIQNRKLFNCEDTISLADRGVFLATTQCENYQIATRVKALTFKDGKKSEYVRLFIVAAINKLQIIFKEYLNNATDTLPFLDIELPITPSGALACDYMESCIREIEKERLDKVKKWLIEQGFNDCTLTDNESEVLQRMENGEIKMEKMKIVNKFGVQNSHNILKSDVAFGSGKVPYVTASEGNNSITSYVSYCDDMKETGNSIVIGGKTLVITYQPDDFFSNDSHNLVLRILDKDGQNEKAQLYMVSALYKSLSYKYSWGNSISKQKIQVDTVMLPVTSSGAIDYDLMETYISALEKMCIGRLKKAISHEADLKNNQ